MKFSFAMGFCTGLSSVQYTKLEGCPPVLHLVFAVIHLDFLLKST